jgi:hypothetical protein
VTGDQKGSEEAPGVDRRTWQEYGRQMEERLDDLHGRIHRGAHWAQPSKRAWIPKADGRKCPLGIAALEDNVVQQAVKTVLKQIYEEDFILWELVGDPSPTPEIPLLDFSGLPPVAPAHPQNKHNADDEECRLNYELTCINKVPENESLLAKLLNGLFDDEKRGATRKQRIDGRELPDFQKVRSYLGSAGLQATSELEGWFLKGFTLTK